MTHYEFHEYANIFPMLEGKDLEALRANIEANGQINKIILYQGKVLDGRNRYRICEMLGIEPETIVYPGDDPIGLVLSQNLHRRHLDESQRAMVATKLATLPPHRPAKENKSANLRTYPQDAEKQEATTQSGAIFQPEAAKMLNVSERQVQSAAQLRREAPPEIIGQVERGEKTVHTTLSVLCVLDASVSYCFTKIFKTANATAIFWRAGSHSFDAKNRSRLVGIVIIGIFQQNFVIPTISEIVQVSDFAPFSEMSDLSVYFSSGRESFQPSSSMCSDAL